METREIGRLCMNAMSNVAGTIADHNLKSMRLSGDSTLRSFEYMTQLAGARTGLDVIELSGAHCRNQLNVLGCYTGDIVDLVWRCRGTWQNPSERERLWQAALSFDD